MKTDATRDISAVSTDQPSIMMVNPRGPVNCIEALYLINLRDYLEKRDLISIRSPVIAA